MVYSFLPSPFDDPARASQYAAVEAALRADAIDSLLLGNVVLHDGDAPIDALLVRPHALVLLTLVPRGGRLSIPALGYGRWVLGGAPLPGADEFDNPFEQFSQQKQAVAEWLRPRFTPEQANLGFITGMVLFGGPVEFAPDVEAALNSASAVGFQLLSEAADLPRRLRQLATPEIDLSAADLAEWAREWSALTAGQDPALRPSPAVAAGSPAPAAPAQAGSFLGQKARALWGWLGADDVPEDPAYGAGSVAARSEEKQQLERLRQQMQADLATQLQALEVREAEREHSIAQLRAQLAEAPPVAAEATALVSRLSAETREKAALEAEMQTSRAELAARNQELDAKIQQLGQLIERLGSQPAPAASAAPASPVNAPPASPYEAPANEPTPRAVGAVPLQEKLKARAGTHFRQLLAWQRRKPRVALVTGAAVLVAIGGWGLHQAGSGSPVPFQENGRWGYADAKGHPVIAARFTAAGPFQQDRAVVAQNGAYGMVDPDGTAVVPCAYDALNPFSGGFARARVGEAYTFVNEKGKELDAYYYNALDFAEGHAAVLDHRGWHYITAAGEPEKPVIFLEAYSFVDGLARVRLADGFTYITPDYLDDPSEGTAPFGRYQQATDFAEGKARVMQKGRRFVINRKGEEVK